MLLLLLFLGIHDYGRFARSKYSTWRCVNGVVTANPTVDTKLTQQDCHHSLHISEKDWFAHLILLASEVQNYLLVN